VGTPPLSALEEADRIRVQPGPLGQILLGQACFVSVLAQQIPEAQMLTGVHRSLSLTSMLGDAPRPSVLTACAHDSTPPERPEIDYILNCPGDYPICRWKRADITRMIENS
jgi:hypothetical protein